MYFLNRLSAAFVGELLFRVMFAIAGLFIYFPITLYTIFYSFQDMIGLRQSLIKNILAGLFTVSFLLLLTVFYLINPFVLLFTLIGFALINYSLIHGLDVAFFSWEHGFQGLFQAAKSLFNFYKYLFLMFFTSPLTLVSLEVDHIDELLFSQNLRPLLTFAEDCLLPAEYIDPVRIIVQREAHQLSQYEIYQVRRLRNMLGQGAFRRGFYNAPQAPVTPPPEVNVFPSIFSQIALSQDEFLRLSQNQQPPLSQEEIERLESVEESAVSKLLLDYQHLFGRLEREGECIIMHERPAKENAVLLVKLYQRNGQEHLVPMSSKLCDKELLRRWINEHNDNPAMGRDPIIGSAAYEGCPTRYVLHPYYPTPESTSGVSQELSDLTGVLRAHLRRTQQRDGTFAATFSYFFSPAASNRSVEPQSTKNTTNAQSPSV